MDLGAKEKNSHMYGSNSKNKVGGMITIMANQSQHIHCIVNNCHYWSQGNKCVANEILVASDDFGSNQPAHVDATMVKQISPTQVNDCMATCCKTFVPKGSTEINEDSILRMS